MNTTTENKDVFHKIVGQERAKRKLNFYLRGHKTTGIVPNMIFVAPKGTGKTFIAQEFRKGLIAREGECVGKPKTLVSVNCSTLKSIKQFFNNLILQYVSDKEVTVLFDEASELPKDVTMALLTILQPNPTNKNTFCYDDYTVDFDFSRQTFLFATSEPHKVFHALTDRLERIDLEEYSLAQLAEIIRRNLSDVQFENGVLEDEVSMVLRGNARAAQKMANDIRSYIGNDKTFFAEDFAVRRMETDAQGSAADIRKQEEQAEAELNGRIREFLGNEAYQEFDSYEERLPDRMMLREFKSSLSVSGSPLSDDQEDELVRIMHDERQNLPLLRKLTEKGGGAAMLESLPPDRVIQEFDEGSSHMILRARQALTPDQFESFTNYVGQLRDMMEIGLTVQSAAESAEDGKGRRK